jgi:hypothetical protein
MNSLQRYLIYLLRKTAYYVHSFQPEQERSQQNNSVHALTPTRTRDILAEQLIVCTQASPNKEDLIRITQCMHSLQPEQERSYQNSLLSALRPARSTGSFAEQIVVQMVLTSHSNMRRLKNHPTIRPHLW